MKHLLIILILGLTASTAFSQEDRARSTQIDHKDGTKTTVKSDRDGAEVEHKDQKDRRTGGGSYGTGHKHDEVVDRHKDKGDKVIEIKEKPNPRLNIILPRFFIRKE